MGERGGGGQSRNLEIDDVVVEEFIERAQIAGLVFGPSLMARTLTTPPYQWSALATRRPWCCFSLQLLLITILPPLDWSTRKAVRTSAVPPPYL